MRSWDSGAHPPTARAHAATRAIRRIAHLHRGLINTLGEKGKANGERRGVSPPWEPYAGERRGVSPPWEPRLLAHGGLTPRRSPLRRPISLPGFPHES